MCLFFHHELQGFPVKKNPVYNSNDFKVSTHVVARLSKLLPNSYCHSHRFFLDPHEGWWLHVVTNRTMTW
jgi:hypothetical protein